MKCSNCGRELYGGADNCPFCGSTVYGFGFHSVGSQGSNSSLGSGSAPFGQNDFGNSGLGQSFYQPSPPKKRKNTWPIILICAICAITLLTAIVLLVRGGDTEQVTPTTLHSPTYTAEPINTHAPAYTTTEVQYPVYTFPVYTVAVTEPVVTTPVTTTAPIAVKPTPSDIIPFLNLRYFLSSLNNEELEIMCAVYEGLMNFEKKITLPYTISPERFHILIEILHYECPELFQYDYTQSYTYYYATGTHDIDTVELPYAFSQSEYISMREQCEDVIDSFISSTHGLSDIEKEKYVYDWFGGNCHYNADKAYAGNPHSAFTKGYAKCDGFSLAMKWAMESMGIQCLCISADALNGGTGHAWNIINLDGKFYLLDATFGVPTDNSVTIGIDFQTYTGFNTADTWAKEHYSIESAFTAVAAVPRCSITTDSYYALKGGLVRSGANPVDVIVSKLDDLKNGRIDRIELQFENSADYTAFVQNSNDRISDALAIYGTAWSGTRTFSHDYYAFTIFVDFN